MFCTKSRRCHAHPGNPARTEYLGDVGLEQCGKSGDLGDRLGDKIKPLSCWDWDPSSMFPLWMAFDAIAFHPYATLSVLYISDLGAF